MAAPMKSMAGKKRKLESLSMDEFMMGGFESSGSESSDKKLMSKKNKKQLQNKKMMSQKQSMQKQSPTNKQKKQKEKKGLMSKHKDSLASLKDQDPEFFEFLKDEDESLLKFGEELEDSDVTDTSDDEETNKPDNTSDEDEDIELPESSDEEEETKLKPKKPAKEMAKEKNKPKKKEEKAKPGKEKDVAKKGKKKTQDVESDESGDDSDDEEDVDLDFDMDDSDEGSDEDGLHVPPEELEEMSDSDDEGEEGDGKKKSDKKKERGTVISMAMIRDWTKRFQDCPSAALIHDVVQAFRAAVQQTASKVDSTKYIVQGSKVFNAVVKLCLLEIPPALLKLLDLPETKDLQKPALPSAQNKQWKKIKVDIRFYLTDVVQLLNNLSEENMVNILLKHIHRLIAFYASFPKLHKNLMKKLITIWSEGQETSRVLAFLCINRIVRLKQEDTLENCVKQMYMAYVKNCKFTSPNSLPHINFMQRSYVEILSLDFMLAYQYAFMYIRQLAIHLRSAISTKKKESCQAVYNWQYVHCLSLWCRVLSMTYPNEMLEPLIYPLVQTTIGTIKLIPTARYYPLRFHCVRSLTMLSKSTNTFIPVLPFLLEIFQLTDFNKKPKSVSMKPLNFACILKLTKPQLSERSFKETVIDQLYELFLEYFHANEYTIGFPELALPALIQLKTFVKNCKVSNFTKQIKQIVDKVKENSEFISARRRTSTINLANKQEVARWERECEDVGTPLSKFYKTWRKLRDRELMHQIAGRDQIVDIETKLPEIQRPKGGMKASEEEKQEFAALFDGDSDNEEDMAARFLTPGEKKKLQKEKNKKGKQKKGKKEDDFSDFDSDELEQLAGSGSDGSEYEMDDGKDESVDSEDGEADDDSDDGEDEDEDDDDDEEEGGDDDEEDDDDDAEDIVEEFMMSDEDD